MSASGMNDLDAGGGRRPSDKGGKIDIQERMRRRFQQKARASPSGSASPSSYSGSQPGATGYGQRLNISSPSQASHVSADISINEPDDNGNSLFGSNTPSKRSPEVKRVHENGNFHKEDTKGQQSKDEFMALFQNNFEDTEQKKSESKTSGLGFPISRVKDEDENDEHMKSVENTDSDHSEEDNRSGNQRLLQGTRNNHPSAFSNHRQPIESADNNPIARLIRLQQQGRKGSDDDSDEDGGAAPIGGFGIGGLPGKSFRADDSDSEGSVEDENPFNSLVKSLKNAQVNVRSQMPNAEADDPFARLRAPIGSGRLGGTQNPDVSPIGGIQGGRGMGRYQTTRGEAPARVSEGGRKSEPGSGQRPGYGGNQPSSGAGNKAPKAGGAPAPANPSGKDSGRSKQADGFGGIGGFGAPIPSDGLDNDPIKQMLRDMAKDAPGGGDDEPPNLKKMLAKLRAEREAGGDGAANQGNNPDPGSQGDGGEEGQMDPLAQMLGGGGGGAGGQANPLAQMFGGGAGGAGGQANPLAQMLGGGAGGAGGQANPLAQMFGGGAGGEGGQSNPLAQMFGGGGAGGGGDALAQMMGGVGAGPAGRRGGSQADMMRQMMSGGRGGGGQADQMMQMLAGAGGRGGGGQADQMMQMLAGARGRGGGGQADQMMQMLAGAGGGRPGGLQGRRQQGGGGEEEEDVNVENPGDMQVIHQMLAYEGMRAQNSHCPRAHNAMNTIIIIDTSGSMGGDAMIEAGEFLSQFLNGLEELQFEFNLEENVALVSVADGGQVVQHFTNDYSLVRRATDTLCAEGPSKLHIGLIMPIALLPLDQNTRGGMLTLQGHMVPPRVILITDGQLSGVTDVPGQQPNQQQSNMLQTMSLELMNQVLKTTLVRIFCVPVGDSNLNYLEMVASTSGGKVVHPTSAKLLSRYHLHQMVVAALKKESANEPSRGIIMEKLKTVTGHCEDAEVDAILEMWQQPPPDVDERDQRLIKQSMDGGGGRGVPMMGGRGRGGGQMDMSAMLAGRGGGGLQDMLGGRGQGGGPGGLPDISAILGGQGGAGAGGLPDMASLLGGMGRGGGGGIADMAALLGGRGGGGGGRPDIAALLGGRGGGGAGGLPDMSALFGGRGRGEGGEGMPDMSALFGGRGGGGAGDMQDLAAMLGGVGGVGGGGAPGNLAAMLGGIRAGGGGNGDGGGGMDMAAMLGGGGGMKMGGGFPGGAGMLQMAEDGGFFSRKQRDEEPPQEKKRGRGYGGDPKVFTLNKLPDNARTSKPKLHELKPSKPLPVPPKVFTGNPKYPDGIIPGMAGGMNPVGGAAFPQNMQNPVPGAGFQQNPQNFGNMAAGGGQQQQSADQFQGSRITRPDLRVEYRERSDSEDEAEAIGGFN